MKTGFKDPIKAPEGKSQKSPWDFEAPAYDERTGCYIKAGTNYGVGHTQPVGKTKQTSSYAVPTGRIDTLKTGYVHTGKINSIEIEEN